MVSAGNVPNGYFHPDNHQAQLSRNDPADRNENYAARPAVNSQEDCDRNHPPSILPISVLSS